MAEKRCNYCFSVIGKGKTHKCNLSSRVANLTSSLLESPSNACDQVVSTIIKHKVEENKHERKSGLVLSHLHGRKLQVNFKKDNNSLKLPILSADDLSKMKTNLNLSDRKIVQIASSVRIATQNRKAIEPGLKSKLKNKTHTVDDFFSYKQFAFSSVKAQTVSDAAEVVVYCTDLTAFLQHIKNQRQITEGHLKLGIDGGGGFLKICLSVQIISNNPESEAKRTKYKDGIVAAKTFKDSGVKKLFVLAVSPNSQENYGNVAQLWSELNLSSLECTIATDLKLANILVGIMSHSSAYPCTWCYATKNELHSCGSLRSIENTLTNYNEWRAAGASRKEAKKYYNCINPPLFTFKEDRLFLDIIPPPELHLMLGVVNTIFSHMLKEYEQESLTWASACYVQREITHGVPAFKGNSCKKLLNNIDLLRSAQNLGVLKYVKAFDTFKKVVEACFGNNLEEGYKSRIEDFKKAYMDLGISVTPKIHAVFYHVEQFCHKIGKALGFFSEQAMESVHSDFKSTWQAIKVTKSHPDYSKKLLRAVCIYNSSHI